MDNEKLVNEKHEEHEELIHEFNNALAVICTIASILKRDLKAGASQETIQSLEKFSLSLEKATHKVQNLSKKMVEELKK